MRLIVFILLLFFGTGQIRAQYDETRYPVIPRPYELLPFGGEFSIDEHTIIASDDKTLKREAEFFRRQVASQYGLKLSYGPKSRPDNVIYISTDSTGIPPEGYYLFINRNEISLYGGRAGIFYGLQTLLQLLKPQAQLENRDKKILLKAPSCSIIDHPRFTWRGMHLDVSRHFFPKENIKEYLCWMAMYKMNTFHWHLTDDQGWRIEIKKYPKLTTVGAWRKGTLTGHYSEEPDQYDTILHGGFYSQNDIREIVRYADSLHITIVPEIEMPGHALAMLAAYPELGCTPGPFDVQKTWGVFDDVLCPKEETFTFLDNVLTEVAALFPGKYIHIGGDECPKKRWEESAFCQELMKKNNLKNPHELQSWFTKRIVDMLQKKGKLAIGWDEILEGGLAEGAAVMSWRGEEGGIAAAKAGHPVVMTPGGYCYFDYYQSANAGEPLAIGGYLPIEKVYSYNPVPAALSPNEKKFILGAQSNLWTEYIPDWKQVQYMIFPRMLALAEVNWTEPHNKDYSHFSKRLLVHFAALDRMKINYAKSYFDIRWKIVPTGVDAIGLQLECNDHDVEIRFSLKEPVNGLFDRKYGFDYPIVINANTEVYAAAFKNGMQVSKTLKWKFDYNLATGKPITLRKAPDAKYNNGGAFTLVDGRAGDIPWRGSDWLGWWGDTLDAVIDLGSTKDIWSIGCTMLVDKGSWIHDLTALRIETSADGKNYSPVNTNGFLESNYLKEAGTNGLHQLQLGLAQAEKARYIRIILYPQSGIPAGEPGAGNPAWLFVSEISVN